MKSPQMGRFFQQMIDNKKRPTGRFLLVQLNEY